MKVSYLVENILWDVTDEEELKRLPSSITIDLVNSPVNEEATTEDYIFSTLSELFDYDLYGFTYKHIPTEN